MSVHQGMITTDNENNNNNNNSDVHDNLMAIINTTLLIFYPWTITTVMLLCCYRCHYHYNDCYNDSSLPPAAGGWTFKEHSCPRLTFLGHRRAAGAGQVDGGSRVIYHDQLMPLYHCYDIIVIIFVVFCPFLLLLDCYYSFFFIITYTLLCLLSHLAVDSPSYLFLPLSVSVHTPSQPLPAHLCIYLSNPSLTYPRPSTRPC